MKPIEHAKSSVRVFGGSAEDYIEIHKWFDQFRFAVNDPRHRMFLHNTAGVIICEQVFGDEIINSDGTAVAVRDIAEHHIVADVGEMRTPMDWLNNLDNEEYVKPTSSKLERLVEKAVEKKFDENKDWVEEYEKITNPPKPVVNDVWTNEVNRVINAHRKFD